MRGDWTVAKYRELCHAVRYNGYDTHTVYSFLENPAQPSVIFRHDIDRYPENALRIAKLESDSGIAATYYTRMTPSVFQPSVIEALADLGHEVGYHYEVLSKARGSIEAAIGLFDKELHELRKYASVYTASAHGSPLSRWNNVDFWKQCELKDFGLVGEAYLSLDYTRIRYYTDTGRSWNAVRTNLRDRVSDAPERTAPIHTTDELITLLQRRRYPCICIQTHPERWNNSFVGMMRSASFDYGTNAAKLLLYGIRSQSTKRTSLDN